jgi:hypothetical protein
MRVFCSFVVAVLLLCVLVGQSRAETQYAVSWDNTLVFEAGYATAAEACNKASTGWDLLVYGSDLPDWYGVVSQTGLCQEYHTVNGSPSLYATIGRVRYFTVADGTDSGGSGSDLAACAEAAASIYGMPSVGSLGQAWAAGFALPMTLYMAAFAVGSVVNFFGTKAESNSRDS